MDLCLGNSSWKTKVEKWQNFQVTKRDKIQLATMARLCEFWLLTIQCISFPVNEITKCDKSQNQWNEKFPISKFIQWKFLFVYFEKNCHGQPKRNFNNRLSPTIYFPFNSWTTETKDVEVVRAGQYGSSSAALSLLQCLELKLHFTISTQRSEYIKVYENYC